MSLKKKWRNSDTREGGTEMKTVGIIGCGAMGKGIVKNFLKNGYKVYVYDLNEQALKRIAEKGAIIAHSPKEVAMNVNIVITSLPTPSIVKETFIGKNGIFTYLEKESIVIDMSTVDSETAEGLGQKAEEKNILFFDCPVSGGPSGANDGTLTIMVGGKRDSFPKLDPILKVVGEHIFYLGKNGAGQAAKLCHNMIVASTIVSLGEAFTVASRAGLELEQLAEVMRKGSATRILDVFGENILKGEYENVLFSLEHMLKDVSLYGETAKTMKVPSFIGSVVQGLFEIAKEKGKGKLDTSAVCEVIGELAGAEIGTSNSTLSVTEK